MRVLMIGGSGLVGNMITSYLKQHHELTIFDLNSPKDSSLSFIEGDIDQPEELRSAMSGHEAIVYMAMGSLEWQTIHGMRTAYDINVKGLHFALNAAYEAGIKQVVYTSSMSVYADLPNRTFSDESIPADAQDLYGFTKRLGEEVCRNAVLNWDMNINVLRLCFPTPDEQLDQVEAEKRLLSTAASDVAKAVSAALLYEGRYQVFMISGDSENKQLNMSRARLLLGWTPTTT